MPKNKEFNSIFPSLIHDFGEKRRTFAFIIFYVTTATCRNNVQEFIRYIIESIEKDRLRILGQKFCFYSDAD